MSSLGDAKNRKTCCSRSELQRLESHLGTQRLELLV
jgi:hypothetical protein